MNLGTLFIASEQGAIRYVGWDSPLVRQSVMVWRDQGLDLSIMDASDVADMVERYEHGAPLSKCVRCLVKLLRHDGVVMH